MKICFLFAFSFLDKLESDIGGFEKKYIVRSFVNKIGELYSPSFWLVTSGENTRTIAR